MVDRTALGDQAQDAFNEAPLEGGMPPSKIYNVAELGDMAAEAETRVQVATVQAMVRRILPAMHRPRSMRSTASSWTKPTGATRSTRT